MWREAGKRGRALDMYVTIRVLLRAGFGLGLGDSSRLEVGI